MVRSMKPIWSICIATQHCRKAKLERLLKVLLPQVNKARGKIEVLIFYNNHEHTIGYYRQKMMEDARGEYISTIDDDDMIPDDFCETLLDKMGSVDYIGFRVAFYNDGKKLPPVYHSLRYNQWSQDENGYYRGVTHINPLKTEIALKGVFPEVTNGEDYQWTVNVHRYMAESGQTFSEHYLDREMYSYDHASHDPEEDVKNERRDHCRPVIKNKYVRFHEESNE